MRPVSFENIRETRILARDTIKIRLLTFREKTEILTLGYVFSYFDMSSIALSSLFHKRIGFCFTFALQFCTPALQV